MELGSAVAPAIVVCVLFFAAAILSSANMMYTKWRFYIVLNAANLFRAVAYANRAAYLSHFRPSLEGVFLAFANAGYAMNVAVLFLAQTMWCRSAVLPNMSMRSQTFWMVLSAMLLLPTIVFGFVIGVVGAGYQYGDLTTHGQSVGSRLRAIATWGLWGCTLALTVSSGRLFLAALQTKPKAGHGDSDISTSGDGHAPTSACTPSQQHLQQQRLISVLSGVSLLLQVHALYNIVILYPQKMQLTSDKYWYPLSALPELLVLVPLTWPALLARVSLCWPRSSSAEDGNIGKGPDSSRSPNRRSVADGGSNESSAIDAV